MPLHRMNSQLIRSCKVVATTVGRNLSTCFEERLLIVARNRLIVLHRFVFLTLSHLDTGWYPNDISNADVR